MQEWIKKELEILRKTDCKVYCASKDYNSMEELIDLLKREQEDSK